MTCLSLVCWNKKKKRTEHLVLVTTDLKLNAFWIVRHDGERSEIEQEYQQIKNGSWQLRKLSSTRYSGLVFYILTVVLSYSLYHLFCNTRAGTRFADKTRQALAFAQLRSRKTHIIAYANGYFAIFETLSFAHVVLQLPVSVQERLGHWLDEHLHTVQVQQQERPCRNGDSEGHIAPGSTGCPSVDYHGRSFAHTPYDRADVASYR